MSALFGGLVALYEVLVEQLARLVLLLTWREIGRSAQKRGGLYGEARAAWGRWADVRGG